jgi:hypothetical protein
VGTPIGKRSLRRSRYLWEENIKSTLKKYDERAWNGLIWLKIGPKGRLL